MSMGQKRVFGNCSNMLKEPELPRKAIEEVEKLFDKKFKYSDVLSNHVHDGDTNRTPMTLEALCGGNVQFSKEIWKDPELMTLKLEMNALKDQLSGQDIETWHAHTTNCNLAGKIIPYVKSLDVELCTQAWVKFYELLTSLDIVPNQGFLSIHLCEAPGAFIASLNHYLQLHGFSHQWDWRATTLSPYYEANTLDQMVSDDRLIRSTYPRWFFGADGSGDITAKDHLPGLLRMVQEAQEEEGLPVLLVTADGSRDCQENPAEQEALLSRLHYCEMISACLILSKHGNLVLKVFTMFESPTIMLLYLLNIMFTQVHVRKPATSKSGNSETYLVCLGYRKNVKDDTLHQLMAETVYSKTDCILHVPDLPSAFLQEHRLCCASFAAWQMGTIKSNMDLFRNPNPELPDKQQLAVETFVWRTRITYSRYVTKLSAVRKEMSAFYLSISSASRREHASRSLYYHKKKTGTFHLRQNISSLSFLERVRLMDIREMQKPHIKLLRGWGPLEVNEVGIWGEPETGDDFNEVHNSRLCDINLVEDLLMLLRNSEFSQCRLSSSNEHSDILAAMLSDLVHMNAHTDGGSEHILAGGSSPGDGQQDRTTPCLKNSVLYWDDTCTGGDGSCELYKSFMAHHKGRGDYFEVKRLANNEDFASMKEHDFPQQLFSNVTSYCDSLLSESSYSQFEELISKRKFVGKVLKILKNVGPGSRVILLTSTFLTRLTAGLLYVLARSWNSISIVSEPNLWLHQLVVLDDFCGMSPALEAHLCCIQQRLEEEAVSGNKRNCMLEIFSFPALLNDRKYVQFLTAHNNYIVAGFVDKMLHHYTKEYQGSATSSRGEGTGEIVCTTAGVS